MNFARTLGLILAIGLAGCASTPSSLKETQTLCVKTGDVFRITLPGNPTTGYLWRMDSASGIEPIAEHFEASSNDKGHVGAPGLFHFDLKAEHPGEVFLRFRYERPWEKEENVTTRIYHIEVRHR